jgi:hypothetical protein
MKLKVISHKVMTFTFLVIPALLFAQQALETNKGNNVMGQNDTALFSNQDGNDLNLNKKVKPEPAWFVRRIKVTAGLFIPINNTVIEVGSANGNYGTTIDLEDDLGFRKSTNTFLGDFQWRISRRSQFEASYFYLSRTKTGTLNKTIDFGDHTYPVDADVQSFFKTSIFRVFYSYAFFVDPKYEFGLMIGAHIIHSEVGISLLGATVNLNYKDDYNFTAPLPDIGIWGGYAISDRFAVKGNLSYFSLKVNNIDGKVTSADFSVLYKAMENLHISLAYTGLNFNVEVEKDKGQGYFKWGYNGPLITASYAFGKKKPF